MGYRNKAEALASIKRNIDEHGHHIYIVSQGTTPRFGYTIGLRETIGKELVLAGAIHYDDADQVLRIINSIADDVRSACAPARACFASASSSFAMRTHRGPGVYCSVRSSTARSPRWKRYRSYPTTIDVPDMRKPWNVDPVWRWLDEKWSLPVPEDAECMTTLEVLRGEPVLEAARWENNYWEMCASDDDRSEKNARLVPIGARIPHSKLRCI